MKVGTLVKVKETAGAVTHNRFGVVIDYRPDSLGGSSVCSWRDDDRWHQEVVKVPIRGEALIMCYEDGSTSWYDESSVSLMQDTAHDDKIIL